MQLCFRINNAPGMYTAVSSGGRVLHEEPFKSYTLAIKSHPDAVHKFTAQHTLGLVDETERCARAITENLSD